MQYDVLENLLVANERNGEKEWRKNVGVGQHEKIFEKLYEN